MFKYPLSIPDDTVYERYGSNEDIVSPGKNLEVIHENQSQHSGTSLSVKGYEIRVATEWEVESSHVREAW